MYIVLERNVKSSSFIERQPTIAGFHCHTIIKTIQQIKSRITINILVTTKVFIKMLKKGLKTDLKLKRFPKFSNRISGSSSGDNESKIQKSLLLILAPKRS